MIAISVSATKSYLHAFPQCVRSIAGAAAHLKNAHFIFVTDTSGEGESAEALLKNELPPGWDITTIRLNGMDADEKDYLPKAQLRIAALQGAALGFARCKLKADSFWSVESDNIVPANALRVLEWTLAMPQADGTPYYHIAAATYPNGLFLGGFGTHQNQIAEDFLPSERILPARLKLCIDACEKRIRGKDGASKKELARLDRLMKRMKNCPPSGNIWEVTAKHGWRRRGWLDFAYPGIGEGAIVPSDWCGLGCTLLGKHALALADFNGYDGRGTQDLFLCWERWHPAGLRIACVPHVACDHVKPGKNHIVHHRAYHEQTPEFKGHLRVRHQPWVAV